MSPALELAGPVATLTLNAPAVANRLAAADLKVLREHVIAINARQEVLVLLLRAAGKHFCGGFDLQQLAQEGGRHVAEFAATVDAFEEARPVTIAFIHGGVYGGGTDLALACDFRIGTAEAEMMMPAARLGLHFYQQGLERYVLRLGLDRAKRVLLTAERFQAREMLECGFLTHLAQAGERDLVQLVDTLTAMAPLALLKMKKHLNHIARRTLDEQELAADIAAAGASADLREGAAAWLQKRAPRFTGR